MFFYCLIPPLFFSPQAQAVTLTVAQAFKVALDLWEIAQEGEFPEQREGGTEACFPLELFRKNTSKKRL